MPAVKNVGEPCGRENRMPGSMGGGETSDSRQCRTTLGASRLPDQPPHLPRHHERGPAMDPNPELDHRPPWRSRCTSQTDCPTEPLAYTAKRTASACTEVGVVEPPRALDAFDAFLCVDEPSRGPLAV